MILATLEFRFAGPIAALSAADRRELQDRTPSIDAEIFDAAAGIISDVRGRGDAALRDLCRRFDGVEIESLEVPRKVRRRALDALELDLRRALERSADNIERVHRASLPQTVETIPEPGITIGRRPDPLDRVGVYAPGGRATYPSSVLMGAVPARVAGVRELILCAPPARTGYPSPVVLAAAELAGVDRVFAIGGAGAVAAMALGTETIPRVDKIVGPGNAYVAAAKLQLAGSVGIDSPAGPTELLVIADESSSPDSVAAELIAQAEHDPRACVVAVCVGSRVQNRVAESLGRLIATAPRAAVIIDALRSRGATLSANTIDDAIAFANAYAPEHLLLATRDARPVLDRVRNAGTVFVGEYASVVFGDYITGANHVLPTGGAARVYSGLSVLDFFRWTTYQQIDRGAAGRLARDAGILATAEGLPGHAIAAQRWRSP